MGTGAITQYIDVAQITLYVFWGFFAALIYYLHREDKREGYPLESDRSIRSGGRVDVEGFPAVPPPKTFLLRDGRTVLAPRPREVANVVDQPLAGRAVGGYLGAPIEPIGDPMLAAIGPGSYALRADVPDMTADGIPCIVPVRVAPEFGVSAHDPDPRGLPVIGADGAVAGVVRELWVDRAEVIFRYLEVEVPIVGGSRRVLLPFGFARVSGAKVQVRSILASQFAAVPALRDPNQITLLEEEKILAYYGGGTLYATAARQEPLL